MTSKIDPAKAMLHRETADELPGVYGTSRALHKVKNEVNRVRIE
jgi:hypothetical protein